MYLGTRESDRTRDTAIQPYIIVALDSASMDRLKNFYHSVGAVRLCRNDLRAVYLLVKMIVLNARV